MKSKAGKILESLSKLSNLKCIKESNSEINTLSDFLRSKDYNEDFIKEIIDSCRGLSGINLSKRMKELGVSGSDYIDGSKYEVK